MNLKYPKVLNLKFGKIETEQYRICGESIYKKNMPGIQNETKNKVVYLVVILRPLLYMHFSWNQPFHNPTIQFHPPCHFCNLIQIRFHLDLSSLRSTIFVPELKNKFQSECNSVYVCFYIGILAVVKPQHIIKYNQFKLESFQENRLGDLPTFFIRNKTWFPFLPFGKFSLWPSGCVVTKTIWRFSWHFCRIFIHETPWTLTRPMLKQFISKAFSVK